MSNDYSSIAVFKTQCDNITMMVDATALLVQRRKYDEPDLLEEFAALAATAKYEVVGTFDIVSAPSAKYGIRSGKAEEIKIWIEANKPDFVLFSPGLKSSQIFRLMELWETEVRDRTQVILEIFDKHARTQQAKLQIEQARLKYELPFERHQIRMRLQSEHTGDRPIAEQIGAGEDLLNLRIQELRRRIATISDKLVKISQAQELKKKKRANKGFVEITLAGYTNAGKSTLHNALTRSEVEIADELFTTLSTKTAELDIPGHQIVLSDSVGFISNLPTSLLQAFNTTLMEVADADVIVLVIDASDSIDEMQRKIDTCLETFYEIGANGVPIIAVLNKIDLIPQDSLEEKIELLSEVSIHIVPISAKERINLENLIEAINNSLPCLALYSISLPYGNTGMSTLSWLHEYAIIEEATYSENHIEVKARLNSEVIQKLSRELNPSSIKKL
ncbi:GTPase HflX [Candidatus Thorarchaeota archaeon]|nr:MAG: GTPase HflX [Candidatus Thorarchaeota archaeon]